MSRVIGITGGIATGKSTVLSMFAELGAEVASADDLAREVLARGGAAYADTVKRFGDQILTPTGEIDRAALGDVIFADPEARRDLNDLTHPHIIARMRQLIADFREAHPGPGSVMVVEVPLLVECGLEPIVDEVLVVAAEHQTQKSRLTRRSGISLDQADSRIAAQMPIERKIEHADRVIWNDGSVESLERSVRTIWGEIRLL